MHRRDIVVIGSSMGGIQALSSLVRQLPRDLPASLLVVQHTSPESPGLLAELLNGLGGMPVAMAEDGMELERGRMVVAPPDRHLLLGENGVRVLFGPRENRSRPSIDPLFRTAAVHHRSRVVGLVLTGLLGDGAAGLLAVRRCGGVPLVQAPDDADYPDMPLRALAAVPDATVAPLDGMGALLVRLVAEQAPEPPPVPDMVRLEARLTERGMDTPDWNQLPGTPTRYTCPECSGAIQQIQDVGPRRYRCRVGHAYTSLDLLKAKDASLEDSLWLALQTLEERASMLEGLAEDDRGRGMERVAATFDRRAAETRVHAGRLRDLLDSLAQ
jgi:two-component system chemotaxis response regulator CheB